MFVVVARFGFSATTTAQVAERINELGIMKAMGASKKQMIWIITSESIFISLIRWGVVVLAGIPFVLGDLSLFCNMIIEAPLQFNIVLLLIFYRVCLFMLIIGYFASKCVQNVRKI